MEEMLNKLSETVGGNLPRLLFALGLLIGAWLVAVIVAAVIKAALKKTTLDEKLFSWIGGGKSKIDSGHVISRAAYWLILLFGAVAFFSKLGMPMVADPIRGMLAKVLDYVPQIASAAILVLIAFIIATLLRAAISGVLSKTPLDKQLGDGAEKGKSLSYSIASTVYWLVFLLFLPMILEALSLDGLLQPVQTMLDNLLGFLPNLAGAGVILFLGWLAAKIVRQVVTNLLAATGLDRVGERAGLGSAAGKQSLSGLVGIVVYALILIPVAISALNALKLEAVSAPASQMLSTILSAIPAVFTAALILGIAYMVGRFASGLVAELLSRAGFNNLPAKLGLGWKPQEGRSPSEMIGYLVLVTTLFFAAMEAARQLGFEALAQILVQFVEFAGHIILGLIIFVVGLYVSNVAANMIQSSDRKEKGLLATLARASILLLVSAMALRQMGLADEIINMAFGLLLFAVALAGGLAFGLGSREVAGKTVERWSKRIGGDT